MAQVLTGIDFKGEIKKIKVSLLGINQHWSQISFGCMSFFSTSKNK